MYPETIDINANPSFLAEDKDQALKGALKVRSTNESINDSHVSCNAKRIMVSLEGSVWEWMPLQESKFKQVSRYGMEFITNITLSK